METGTFTVRLTDSSIIQVDGQSFSLNADDYAGNESQFSTSFRLICEWTSGKPICVLEVVLSDDKAGRIIHSFAGTAQSPKDAIKLLDGFDPLAYLPLSAMQANEITATRLRYDERARRFRDESLKQISAD